MIISVASGKGSTGKTMLLKPIVQSSIQFAAFANKTIVDMWNFFGFEGVF